MAEDYSVATDSLPRTIDEFPMTIAISARLHKNSCEHLGWESFWWLSTQQILGS